MSLWHFNVYMDVVMKQENGDGEGEKVEVACLLYADNWVLCSE